MKRITVNPNADARQYQFTQNVDTDLLYKVDFSKVATEQSSSVSSVAWTSAGYRTLDIAGEALSSDVASAYVSGDFSGEGVVKVKATLASGYTWSVFLDISVEDPEYRTVQ